jgi:hypothetical protein
MAFKACRSLTLILLLSLSVVALTATVEIRTVTAAVGGGGTTAGDPDSPKDTGPRPASTQSQPSVSCTAMSATPASMLQSRPLIQWMVVQQLLSSMLGRPGLLR